MSEHRTSPRAVRFGWLGAFAAIAALLVATYMVRTLYTPGVHSPITDPDDFRAFYCAGRALAHGEDPYALGSIMTCEHAAAASFGLYMPPRMVLPAPVPPYALAIFVLFGIMPFGVASGLWFALSLAALIATTIAVRRLCDAPIVAIALAFILADGLGAINEGQIAPLVTFALVCAALALRARRSVRAAGFAVSAMLAPHVALPGVATFAALRRSYVAPIAGFAFALVALDLAAGGPARTIEYALRVLPVQARAETDQLHLQFGLPTVLWALGTSGATSRAIGVATYVLACVAAVYVSRRVAQRFDDPAFAVLLPPAFALLASPYVHLTQMVVALPGAFLCAVRLPRLRVFAIAAVVGLAVPTQDLAEMAGYGFAHKHVASAREVAPRPNDLAERGLMAYLGSEHVVRPTVSEFVAEIAPKLPTWFALLALIGVAIGNCAGSRASVTLVARAREARPTRNAAAAP